MAVYKTIVLESLSRWENPNKPGTGFELRIVHCIQDGKSKGVGVEKVYFYANGEKTIGKPLMRMDLQKMDEARDRIDALIKTPPPIPPEAPPPDNSLEEVPY